jgi:hypothetical protein
MQFVLNQLPMNSRHISRLLCEDAPIFLDKFDQRKFLFRIQVVAYASNLGRLLHEQRNHLAECVLRLNGRLGGLDLGHDGVLGDLAKACFNSWSFVDAVSAVSQLFLSQSKARLTSSLIAMMPRSPSIFKTK